MWPFTRTPVVPVLRLSGAIGMASPLRPGLSIASLAEPLQKAFEMSKTPSVALIINSPGGSAVQSSLILKRIRALAEENEKKVHVFLEDVAASGGYYLAIGGDEIFAEPSSIVGSIGVISSGFGFVEAIDKLGIERRVYTAGRSKAILDPFLPQKPEDIERLASLQRDAHDVFIGAVKERRAGKLKGPDEELFSGAFWSGKQALDYGLIDGISDIRTRMREIYGDDVKLKVVPIERPGLLSKLRRSPSLDGLASLTGAETSLTDELLSTLETRALWARYGL
ncbi:MAG: S49 family peptidase [Hyphomicrobium sp. 32-62-53]|nr:MAG: S49 family peptidase [Hyphomicrobium sp. 12-62-95]OYX99232.1 MAG: S49 family peptidase [Hyphomicrobium sp. 32-62-53]